MNNYDKCCLQGCVKQGTIPLSRIEGIIKIRKDLVGTYPRDWKLCTDDFERLVKTIRCCVDGCTQQATPFEVTPSRKSQVKIRSDCPHYQLCLLHANKFSELVDKQPIKRQPEIPVEHVMPPMKKQADYDSATESNEVVNSDTSTEVHDEENIPMEFVKEEPIQQNQPKEIPPKGNEIVESKVNVKEEIPVKKETEIQETKEQRDAKEIERLKEMLQSKEINQISQGNQMTQINQITTIVPPTQPKETTETVEQKTQPTQTETTEVKENKENNPIEIKEKRESKEINEIKNEMKEGNEMKMKEEIVEERHCCISNCDAEVSGEVPIIQPLHFHICSNHLNKIIKLWKVSLLQKQVVLDEECQTLIKENVGDNQNNPLYQYTNPSSNDVKCALCCGFYSTEETYNCSFCPFTFCVECFKHLCLTLGCPQQFISNKAKWKCFVCSRCEENQMQRNVFIKEQLISLLEILKKKLDEGCLIGTNEDELREFIESVK